MDFKAKELKAKLSLYLAMLSNYLTAIASKIAGSNFGIKFGLDQQKARILILGAGGFLLLLIAFGSTDEKNADCGNGNVQELVANLYREKAPIGLALDGDVYNYELSKALNSESNYSLKSVRTISKDESLKAVSCAAELYVEGKGLKGMKKSISFSLQITEDGNLWAEILN